MENLSYDGVIPLCNCSTAGDFRKSLEIVGFGS